jgi:glyoxylate/hydroxypyruvate reductase
MFIIFFSGVDAVRTGEWSSWKPMWLCGTNMMNKTIGIFGFDLIGC